METTCRRFVRSEGEALADFLAGDTWPFHASAVTDRDQVRRWIAEGRYDGPDDRTFWILADDRQVGVVHLTDLGDGTPLFDLRIRTDCRGRGFGRRALTWITRHVFEEFPRVQRIEGTTRQDNVAMRRTFQRCGYAKEAHYRDAWPGAEGAVHDAVGYAILRRDWAAGTVTVPRWHDEHLVAGHTRSTRSPRAAVNRRSP